MAYEEILTVNSSIQSKRTTKTTASSSTEVLKDGELLIVRDGTNPPNLRAGDGTTQIKNLKDMVPPIDNTLSSTSTNPVQNKVINTALSGKANSTHTHKASDITSGAFGLTQGGTGSVSGLAEAPRNAIIKKAGNADDYLYYTTTNNGALYASEENGNPVFGTLPLAQGGTGATSAADARSKLGAAASSHTHGADAITGTLGIAHGGTGATTAANARANLGAFSTDGGTLTGNVILSKNNPWIKFQDGDSTGYLQMYSSGTRIAVGFGSTKSLIVDNDGCLILTSAMYGTTLPAAGKKGRIFFKKV